MSNELQLYVPRPEDGWFYCKMMSDPATMAYNTPWFPPDGCIPDPEDEWLALQKSWIGQAPERFYAFLRRKSDGAFVGDVNYHYAPDRDWWDMGIVIYAPERGKGYGGEGLRLLLDRAFRTDGVACLHNEFETSRGAACHIHRTAGFRETGMAGGFIRLELTREEYLGDDMDVLRIFKPSFTVIGIEGSTDDGEGFIEKLWGEANARFSEIEPLCKRESDGAFTGFWGAMTDFSRSFRPWEDFSRGLYLAGAECVDGAEPPEGWTKWVVPSFEYLRFDCGQFTFPQAIDHVKAHGFSVAGAVQDHTDPRTGKGYIYVPIKRAY